MPAITHQRITSPQFPGGDGLGLCDGRHWEISDCIIDLSGCGLDTIDECSGITWGASAVFTNCWIRGAGKLVLCGSGDRHKAGLERGQAVRFEHCILENGGRRFPEVQAGMTVYMQDCLIRNWADPNRFDTRSFGAWAHSGGRIYAANCVFWQNRFRRPAGQFLRDCGNHIGQAVNDSGLKALLRPTTYLPGVCRGLMAGPDGRVVARNCYRNHRWIRLEGRDGIMDEGVALELVWDLEGMAERLEGELG